MGARTVGDRDISPGYMVNWCRPSLAQGRHPVGLEAASQAHGIHLLAQASY
jgi:hypothetical protein